MAFNDSAETNELQKLINMIVHYAYGVWSYRWIAVLTAWGVALIGWYMVYQLPNVYQAATVVHVDTENVLRPLLKGLSVESNVMDDVAVVTRAIVSRPNLETVAREIDLDVASRSPAEFEARLKDMESRINISRDREGLYQIGFTDANRETALVVVKSLLDTFVEDTLGNKLEDSAKAEQTLAAQIRDYETRLTEAEDRLKRFKQENVGMMPGERGDYYDQLQHALAERDAVEQQLRIERQKGNALQRQIMGEEPTFGLMTPVGAGVGGASSLDGQIAQLEQRLTDLSIEYTDKHPEVSRTRSLLEDLRVRRQQELASRTGTESPAFASSPLDLNPVYQNLKIQLSTIQVEIARLEATLREKEQRVSRLQELVDVIPQVEAQLTRLNRDYDVVRQRYQEMLARWENLQTSKRVRSGTDDVQFRIIEPPFAATEPVGPPRALYVMGVLVLGLGAGVGMALLISLMRPVYFLRRELSEIGLPVLGTVSRFHTAVTARQAFLEKSSFAGLLAGLLVAVILAAVFADPASELVRRLV